MDHVTEEEVMDVARAIMIRGERVSTNKIRSALGRGSYSTIMAILVKNGIKTSKSGVITDNTTGGSMELLHELKNNLIKEQYRHELLKKELADKYKHIDISSIILLSLIKDILIRHLHPGNPLVKFISDQDTSWLIASESYDLSQQTISSMHNILLNEFIKEVQSMIKQPGELRLRGGIQSLKNVERMLQDLLNRTNDDGVYNYRN